MAEIFNVDFDKFMNIIEKNQSAFQMSQDEINETYRLASYYGIFSGNACRDDDKRNSISLLIETLQGMIQNSTKLQGESSELETFHVNFENFMSVVKGNRTAYSMPQEEINETYRLGSYYGIFSGEAVRDDDRGNSVSLLISTLQGMIENSAKPKEKEDKKAKLEKFHVRINNGPEQSIQTKTGLYHLAVGAALAMLDYEEGEDGTNIVEIWCPELLPKHGPYFYLHDGHHIYNARNPNEK